MLRFIFLGLFFVLSSLALAADEVVDYLKRYEGRWVGDFTIHSPATGYTQTIPVEQRYWWEEGQLHGMSVTEMNGKIESAESLTFIKDGKLRSEVLRVEIKEVYFGVLQDGGIIWISENLGRATDYQMKESLVEKKGERWLHTDGFDSFDYEGELAHLVYRGRLMKQAEEGK